MSHPDDRRYAETHEWHKIEDDLVVIGLSKFAVDELTDITFLDFLKTDGKIKTGEPFAEIESVKASNEVYCAIDGEIVEVNQAVSDDPAIINNDPHEAGWLIKIKPDSIEELSRLMDAATYNGQCQ